MGEFPTTEGDMKDTSLMKCVFLTNVHSVNVVYLTLTMMSRRILVSVMVLWLHFVVVKTEVVKPLRPEWIPTDIFSQKQTYNHESVIK